MEYIFKRTNEFYKYNYGNFYGLFILQITVKMALNNPDKLDMLHCRNSCDWNFSLDIKIQKRLSNLLNPGIIYQIIKCHLT